MTIQSTTEQAASGLRSPTIQYAALPFVVECRSSHPFFEQIAAFDHIKVAYRYAQDCLQTNSKFEYRLRDLESGKTFAVSLYNGWGA